MFDATIVTPSMMKRCRLASLVLSVLHVFVQRGEELRRRGQMTYLLANENMGNTIAGEQSGSPEPAQGRRPPMAPPATPSATPERSQRSRQKRKSKLEYCVYF